MEVEAQNPAFSKTEVGSESSSPSKRSIAATTEISRIRESTTTFCGSQARPSPGVIRACVTDQNRPLDDTVTALAISWTLIDSVFVVETPADRVTLDDLETHVVWELWKAG